MTDNIVIVTGGFDPLHSGHIAYIKAASMLGRVVVGLNSDQWLARKKGAPFMSFKERFDILANLKNVMHVIAIDDSDNTACDAIRQVKKMWPRNQIIFANGGDRREGNVPEAQAYANDPNVVFAYGVGGIDKQNSSSVLLNQWKASVEPRPWGYAATYYSTDTCKIKRLSIKPGGAISMQRHMFRDELWFIEKGSANVYTHESGIAERVWVATLTQGSTYCVLSDQWHQIENIGSDQLHVIEIQHGNQCNESDIVKIPPSPSW